MFENLKTYALLNIEKITGGTGSSVGDPPPQSMPNV